MYLITKDAIIRSKDEKRIPECSSEQIVVENDCNMFFLWLKGLTSYQHRTNKQLESMVQLLPAKCQNKE